MTQKVLVTGGSGFIGTNLGERLIALGYEFINVDIRPPKSSNYLKNYHFVDVTDFAAVSKFIADCEPQFLIHLAARTDLLGDVSEDYLVNTDGVENICTAISQCPSIKRALFASSMLVCRAGHIPEKVDEFSANTAYGLSKVEGEKIVRKFEEMMPSAVIFRPTSIWGPWFDAPYKTFFEIVLSRRYFRIGSSSSTKTYGYVENAVNQILSLMVSQDQLSSQTLNYIGDAEPVNIDEWADLISSAAGLSRPLLVPKILIVLGGVAGDLLARFGVNFPLTSFRVKNMTTDNILSKYIVKNRFESEKISFIEGIKRTLNWLKEHRGDRN